MSKSSFQIAADTGSNELFTGAGTDAESPPFPVHALPPVLRDMATAISEIVGVPEAMSAPMILATAGAAMGKGLRVKSLRGRITPGNLYVMLAKASGSGGSSAYKLATGPMYGYQANKRREFESSDKPAKEAEKESLMSILDECRKALKGKSGEERKSVVEEIRQSKERLADVEKYLVEPLLSVTDATPEGMANLLRQHGECLAHFDSDAGDALASILGRYSEKEGSNETLWLKSLDLEPIIIVRKNTGTIHLGEPCLSCLFVATPEKVATLFKKSSLCEGGLLPRFLVCDPKARALPMSEHEAESARQLPSHISQSYEALIFGLIGNFREDANETPEIIDMTKAARLLFLQDYNGIVGPGGRVLSPFENRWTEQAIRIAVVLHACRHAVLEKRSEGTWGLKEMNAGDEDLDEETAKNALTIRDWFADHQKLFLAPQAETEQEEKWEKARRKMLSIPSGITAREIYNGRTIAHNKEQAEALLAEWLEEGRIQKIEPQQGKIGRAVPRYVLSKLYSRT
jgi:hypothetical protein